MIWSSLCLGGRGDSNQVAIGQEADTGTDDPGVCIKTCQDGDMFARARAGFDLGLDHLVVRPDPIDVAETITQQHGVLRQDQHLATRKLDFAARKHACACIAMLKNVDINQAIAGLCFDGGCHHPDLTNDLVVACRGDANIHAWLDPG